MIALTESECKKKRNTETENTTRKWQPPRVRGEVEVEGMLHIHTHVLAQTTEWEQIVAALKTKPRIHTPRMRKIYRERHARYMSMSRDSPWDSVLSVSCSQKRKRQHEHEAQSAQEAKPTKSQTTSTNSMQRTTRNCDREGKKGRETHSRSEQ